MALDADPAGLAACHLDDFAAAWARRLMVPVATLARREGEHDGLYRPRLLMLLKASRTR